MLGSPDGLVVNASAQKGESFLTATRIPASHRATATEETKLRRAENVFDAADRNDDPGRAIVQFVADFVNGFVEEISLKQDLEVVFIGWNEIGAVRGGEIAVEKDAAHLAVPKIGPAFEEG